MSHNSKYYRKALLKKSNNHRIDSFFSTEGSLDALMRICAEGPVNLTNDNLEQIIDIFKAMKPRKQAL